MIDEQGKVEFNEQEQAELNRIIEDRLGRERSKYADHDDIRGVVEELRAFGYEGTPAQIREAVKAQREATQQQTQLAELEEKARTEGTTPALLSRIEKLEKKLSESDGERNAIKQAEEQKKQADVIWNEQVKEFEETHQDVDLASLNDDEDFMDFWQASAPSQTITKVWERYSKLVGKAKADATAKIKSNVDRSTSSGRSKGDPSGGTYGLSATQQSLAQKAGMSLKEYSDMMKDIT